MSGTRRVLIVDDDQDFCESLADILKGAGYAVAAAATAREALEKARSLSPGVSLVDVRLGGDNGTELVRILRQDAPGSLCVMMTAYAAADTVIRALKAGAHDYITKPFEAEDLFATLDRCFEVIRLQEEKEIARADLQKRNSELSAVNERLREMVEGAKTLAALQEEVELERALLTAFARVVGVAGGSFYALEKEHLRRVGSLDPDHAPLRLQLPLRSGCVFETALRTGQPVLLEDVSAAGYAPSGWRGYRNGAALALPVTGGHVGVLGVVSLHSKETPPFTAQDLDMCNVLVSLSLEVIGSKITRPAGPPLNTSSEITTAGRRPVCSSRRT